MCLAQCLGHGKHSVSVSYYFYCHYFYYSNPNSIRGVSTKPGGTVVNDLNLQTHSMVALHGGSTALHLALSMVQWPGFLPPGEVRDLQNSHNRAYTE